MSLRFLLLFLSLLLWLGNGFYAFYVNRLKLEQYKYTKELRKLRRENNEIYFEIYKRLNFEKALQYAKGKGFVAVKPYRVVNFQDTLKGKPLIDFYNVWFNDTLTKIAKRFGISVKELKKYNPRTRWGYVIPGMRLIIPLKGFPYIVESSSFNKTAPQEDNQTKGNGNKADNLVPGKPQVGKGRGNPAEKF